jgi:D-alanine-D-alanine ligase
MEMFDDNLLGDVAVAGLLELAGVPFTGSGPKGLALCQDKALAKKLFAYDGVPSPRFAVFAPGAPIITDGLRMPLIVKPLRCDASIGVDESRSLVHDAVGLARRVHEIHDEVHDTALAEEYVDGRELYVSVLGNDPPRALPIIEIDFSGLPAGAPHVLGVRAKFEVGSPEYRGTHPVIARLPAVLEARVTAMALAAYRALGVRDYGRVDLRVTRGGDAYVLEVNGSCYLEEKSELALAARAAGLDYTALVNRIAALAVERARQHRHPIVAAPICSS